MIAKVHTHAQENGRISKTIRVVTDDPGLKQIILRLNATVIAPIEIRPSPRVWLSSWEGHPAEATVLLHRQDGKPLKIERVGIEPAGLVKLTVSRVTTSESRHGIKAGPGDVWLTVSAPASPHVMSRSGKALLTTNDPRQRALVLPLFVQVRPELEAVPPRLTFVVQARGPKEYWRIVELRAHGSTRFQIRAVTTDRPDLFKVVIMPPGLGAVEKIRIGLDREAALRAVTTPVHSVMTVTTSDPKHPSITIQILVTNRNRVAAPPKIHLLQPKLRPVKKVIRNPKLPPPGSGPVY